MKNRVVITGIGTITTLGLDTKETWENMIKGESGIDFIDIFDTSNIPIKFAGQIRGFDIRDYGFSKEYQNYDRAVQFALACTQLAIEDSKIKDFNKPDTGVFIGNAGGNLDTGVEILEKMDQCKNISWSLKKECFRSLVSRHVSEHYNLIGPCQLISTGCTSGLDSIGMAMRSIARGETNVAICGGTEAPINFLTISAFAKIGALSLRNDSPRTASRPYDKDRDGFVLAEGAGILILENMGHAIKRGAKIYAELDAYSTNLNAYHMTGMPKDGIPIADAISGALKKSETSYEEIDYINSHGSSTPLNDYSETQAYKIVFKEKAPRIPISSIKSMIGHSLGAIGSIEILTCALVIENQIIPPTININETAEGCDLDYVPNKCRKSKVNKVVSNASGFSGLSSAIVMSSVS